MVRGWAAEGEVERQVPKVGKYAHLCDRLYDEKITCELL